jgi:hypothetical protein
MSALPLKADIDWSRRLSALCQKPTHARQQSAPDLGQVLPNFGQ